MKSINVCWTEWFVWTTDAAAMYGTTKAVMVEDVDFRSKE